MGFAGDLNIFAKAMLATFHRVTACGFASAVLYRGDTSSERSRRGP
jgi:hypothetical protein